MNIVLGRFTDAPTPILIVLGSNDDDGRTLGIYDDCCPKGTNGPLRDSSMTTKASRRYNCSVSKLANRLVKRVKLRLSGFIFGPGTYGVFMYLVPRKARAPALLLRKLQSSG